MITNMFTDGFVISAGESNDRIEVVVVGDKKRAVEIVCDFLFMSSDQRLYHKLEEILNESI